MGAHWYWLALNGALPPVGNTNRTAPGTLFVFVATSGVVMPSSTNQSPSPDFHPPVVLSGPCLSVSRNGRSICWANNHPLGRLTGM